MKGRVASLPPRALLAIAVASVLVYTLALWFLLVSPKRAEATTLADDVIAAELRLADARVATRPAAASHEKVGDLLLLAKAMPASADQAGLLLELELLGRATGMRIATVVPGQPVLASGSPTFIPVVVTGEGSYREIARFLARARALVQFRGGAVRATGRVLAVQSVELSESNARGFPLLDAIVTFNSFVYDGPIVPVAPSPGAPDPDELSSSSTAARSTP